MRKDFSLDGKGTLKQRVYITPSVPTVSCFSPTELKIHYAINMLATSLPENEMFIQL